MTAFLIAASVFAALSPELLLLDPEGALALKEGLLVDCRPAEAFAAGHIPGAAHLDQAALSEDRGGVANELKDPEAMGALLAAAGLAADRHIVIYSAMDTPADFKNATRLFWILEYLSYERVSILDGGFARWKAEGRPVETGPSTVGPVKPGKVSTKPRQALIAEFETVAEMAATGQGVLVDCRTPEEYAGLSKKDFVAKKGNIPGSVNVPSADLIDPATLLLAPAKALAESLAPAGAAEDTPIVTYCNSGRDATVGYFAFRRAGHDRVAVYDGSMSEWAAQEGVPAK